MTVRCLICGGDHEPRPDVCDGDGMDRQITMLGARRWNQLTGYIQRKLWARYKAAKDECDNGETPHK